MDEQTFQISPPNAMFARGVKFKIKDIEEITNSDNKLYSVGRLTNFEVGVQGERSIVVPSFGTTSAIF